MPIYKVTTSILHKVPSASNGSYIEHSYYVECDKYDVETLKNDCRGRFGDNVQIRSQRIAMNTLDAVFRAVVKETSERTFFK